MVEMTVEITVHSDDDGVPPSQTYKFNDFRQFEEGDYNPPSAANLHDFVNETTADAVGMVLGRYGNVFYQPSESEPVK